MATASTRRERATQWRRPVVQLSKPLGLVLEEDKKTKSIRVAEIVPGSSAARTGLVTVGDTLVATSGYVYTRESTYQDTVVKSGQQLVRLAVRGERFETVMAAIGSHPGHVPVTLELQKCK
ncbi:unnamed protein product [Pedinophyceae sp. YPF-701]|nr:unnamed protein product [Pedinophyceae sp. YPF-701]